MIFDIDYILLNILMLATFMYVGKYISKGANYWKYATMSLIVFTFVLGSRYDRGWDYEGYVYGYRVLDEKYNQYGFTFINKTLQAFQVDDYHIFYYYAFITMLGGLVFLKRYKQYGLYIFPAFLLATYYLDEYQVRQSLSYGFLFIYILQLFELKFDTLKEIFSSKNIKCLFIGTIFLFFSYIIHTANILNAAIITILYLFVRVPIPYVISIPIVFFSSYILPRIYDLSYIMPILNLLGDQNDMFDRYIDTSDKWFSSSAFSSEYVENPIVKAIETVGVSSLLYFGYKLIKLKKIGQDAIAMYNFFFIGTVITLGFKLMQMLARVGNNMRCFWFFPIALVLYYRKDLVRNKLEGILFFFLIYWLYGFLKYLFMHNGMCLFLWDVGHFI